PPVPPDLRVRLGRRPALRPRAASRLGRVRRGHVRDVPRPASAVRRRAAGVAAQPAHRPRGGLMTRLLEPVDAVTMDLLPRLVPLGGNLWGASFTLMKMLPAHHIVDTAIGTGHIGPDTLIVESTSGTFGLALAMKAALVGRRLTLVTDPAMDERLCRR